MWTLIDDLDAFYLEHRRCGELDTGIEDGPVTDKALEEIIFRAAHGVMESLAPYPREQRVAMLPSVVRMLLTTFLEEVAGDDGSPPT
jgi:hypothetical protein